MKGKGMAVILFAFVVSTFLIIKPAYTEKQVSLTREQAFERLHQAFQAQLDLGKKHVTKQQAVSKLKPYFDSAYIELFLNENLIKETQGYITNGSDFALYYIPYFSYNDHTKVMYDSKKEKIYVYEHFPAVTDGPVTYEDHYEMIVMSKQQSQWKISKYVYHEAKPLEIQQEKSFKELQQ